MTFGIIMTTILIALGVASLAYMIYVIVRPNNKSISHTMRDDDEKYE